MKIFLPAHRRQQAAFAEHVAGDRQITDFVCGYFLLFDTECSTLSPLSGDDVVDVVGVRRIPALAPNQSARMCRALLLVCQSATTCGGRLADNPAAGRPHCQPDNDGLRAELPPSPAFGGDHRD